MRKTLTDTGVITLCRALLAQANRDLLRWKKTGDCESYNKSELTGFYLGPLFGAFCGDIDPQAYMKEVLHGRQHVAKAYHRNLALREARYAKSAL